MSNIAIKAENLSKAYQLGEIGTGTISRDLERWWAKTRGKEDPFLRIGETNDRSVKGTSDIVWSLKDLNFEIEQGDAVGIIGKNGAGKSTLLKILSRVTSPTTGSVKVKGRIASLLEVGTGFHPELTGRENIFLNGAILGMRKAEIKKHFDAIVDFSGVERYIDTPVKRYSSGMYVRLAFAVAAHLESEILIVDEVLAVGDAEFQKKCLGKMGEVSKGEGRTVLFVSHNLTAIKTLCTSGIYLQNGLVQTYSNINEVIRCYNLSHHTNDSNVNIYKSELIKNNSVFKSISIIPNSNNGGYDLNYPVRIDIEINNYLQHLVIGLQVIDENETILIHSSSEFGSVALMSPIKTQLSCDIPAYTLNAGKYYFNFVLAIRNKQFLDSVENFLHIEIEDNSFKNSFTTTTDWIGKSSPKIIEWQ